MGRRHFSKAWATEALDLFKQVCVGETGGDLGPLCWWELRPEQGGWGTVYQRDIQVTPLSRPHVQQDSGWHLLCAASGS